MSGSSVELDPALALSAHHDESLGNLRESYAGDPTVLALLLAGSLAHGFAGPNSDIDFIAVVTPEEFHRRVTAGELTRATADGCTYPGGYTDGKFVDLGYLRQVAESGSEPARFAFRDARFVFEREPLVRPLMEQIVRYPEAGVEDRIERFAAQLLAWRWYHSEAVAKHNRYLQLLALQKLTLFSCRIVLAENRLLYPYHKWMLRVTEMASHRPEALMSDLDRLLDDPTADRIDAHVRTLLAFFEIDHDELSTRWGGFFLRDNEQTWMTGDAPIDDV